MMEIEQAVKNGDYYFTIHGIKRSEQRRNVEEIQVINILRSKIKYHERRKDTYSEKFKTWNYAIRGKSVDDENIRIILSFDESDMLIITVINLSE